MRGARAVTVAAVLALVLLGVAWELWLAPTGRGLLALKVLPLAAMLAGLARHRLQTFRALSLLVWLYVLEGLLRASTEHGLAAKLAALEIACALVLFSAAAFYIRRRLRSAAPVPA